MAIVLSFVFVACDKAGTDKTGTDIVADYKVTIHPNNGQGDIVWDITKAIPTITKDGFHIAGYFLDAQLTISTTLESLKATGITKNIDVYIKWEEDVCEHVEVIDAAVEPTCTEKGLTEGKHCSKCGKILKAQTEIDALGHDLETHNGQEATCTEKGWKAYVTCKREGCDHTTYEEIPALGHTGGTATCTEQAVCERCNEKYGNALGHKYGTLIPQTNATCSATGIRSHYKCSSCNKLFADDEHKTEITETDLIIPIDENAHDFGKWTRNDDAETHTRVCSFNSEHTETEDCFGGTATCTEQAVCEKCNEKYGKALGHDYQGGVCTRCGTERASEGLEYSLNSDGNGYTVTGIGTCTDTELVIPSKHNSKPVTSIGRNAFDDCSQLTSITIPNSVTNIDYAFSNCRNLSNIYYTGDIKGWCEIDGLYSLMQSSYTRTLYIDGIKVEGDLVIPDSVTSIGEGAFLYCTGLSSVTIPNSVTSIGEDAFYGCSRLTNITIPDSVTNIGREAFDYTAWYYNQPYYDTMYLGKVAYGYKGTMPDNTTITLTLREGTLGIAEGAFSSCDGLTNIILPDGLITIGDSAFSGCKNLTSIVIPNSVTILGDYAFSGCKNLTSVTIGNGVTSLGDGVFESCKSLTSITIPASVTNISLYAFPFCSGLKNINVTKGNPKYHSNGNCLIETESKTLVLGCQTSVIPTNGSVTKIGDVSFWGCENLTNISIPDGITSIGFGAFVFCKGLASIAIPASVTSIADSVFLGCSGLSSITIANGNEKYLSDGNCLIETESKTLIWGCENSIIPADGSVTSIGRTAFYDCTELTSITIPDSVTSIGDSAFNGCTGLTSVTIPGSVTSIGEYAFNRCYKLVEVYNKSSLSITAGSEENGYVAYYAKNIYTEEGKSKLATDENGYVIYTDGDEKILIAYLGTETELTLPAYITQIYKYAFRGCNGLTSVTIGSGVTSIGDDAFSDCTGLTSISGSATIVSAVAKQAKPTSFTVNITSGTNIDNSAFYGCTGLTSVTIPESVTSIGQSAFSGCIGLTSIYYTGNIAGWCGISGLDSLMSSSCTLYIGGKKVEGDLIIPNSVTSIGDYAFYCCTGLTSITIPDSVTSIGDRAFDGCTGLTSVTIGNGVTSIGEAAFRGCSALTSITIPDSVTSIGDRAFDGCSGLTSITIPSSVTSIGGYAFSGCSALASIIISDSVTSIGNSAFDGCSALTSISGSATNVITVAKQAKPTSFSVNITSGTSIGDSAFYGCSGLTSITIPDSVTNIGRSAFYGCSGLTSITIPDSVTDIDWYAFSWCSSLTSVTIPDSVTSIGDYAFSGCSGLTSITIGTSVTSIGDYAFSGCDRLIEVYNKSSLKIIAGDSSFGYVAHSAKNVFTEEGGSKLSTDGNGYIIYTDGDEKILVAYRGTNTELVLPSYITKINQNAFRDCTGLTSVTIPDSVTSIGEGSFYGCDRLTSIAFSGTMEEWSAISKGTDWNNNVPSTCKVVCTDGEISISEA